ncbi:MAG: 50S ribosome-binding GTPase [Candidatus Omnitrophica bacterium]|nr:50S ribosome-binding GTPase [Candidatus Omnitrophota bacterium]
MIFSKARVVFQSGSGGQGSRGVIKLSSGKSVGIGGDGGKGGSVILKVNLHLYDLKTFKGNKKFRALNGEPGSKKNKKGPDAEDLIVGVPLGTRVIEQGKVVFDLIKEDDQILLCRGGSGGLGNHKRNYITQAKEGQVREVVLDYRIPHDVAILGFPNCGKTSLFNSLCGQNQKVADYPFTTTSCVWAPCDYEFDYFTVLDTPPLTRIEKPSQEAKNNFLGQILRSKVVIFLSDNQSDYENDFQDIRREVERYDSLLLKGKKIFYLLAKIDTIDKKAGNDEFLLIGTKEKLKLQALKKIILKSL